MPDVLTLLFICFVRWMGKLIMRLFWIWKWFCIIMLWLAFVPLIDAIMVAIWFIGWLIGTLRKSNTPHIKWGKWAICHPTWN